MPKLGIPVWVIVAFLQLPIALQAVVLLVEELRDSYIAERMILLAEFGGERPGALADPPQGRFGTPTGSAVHQVVQCCQPVRIRPHKVLASRTRTTNAPCQRGVAGLDFANTLGDGLPGQATGTMDHGYSAIIRRVRSSRSGQMGLNFCVSTAIELMDNCHITPLP